MEVTIRRRRAAGITEVIGPLDTSRLERDEARTIEDTIRTAQFFTLPASSVTSALEPFQFQVMVRDGDRVHVVVFSEEDQGIALLRALVQAVIAVHERQRTRG